MDVRKKIIHNLRQQLMVAARLEKLRNDIRQFDVEQNTLNGQITILAELFQEEHGQSLQEAINSDGEWRKVLDRLRDDVQKEINQGLPAAPSEQVNTVRTLPEALPVSSTQDADIEETPIDEMPEVLRPALLKHDSNKKVDLKATRTREPVRIVVDDNPPGPGRDEPD